MQAWGVLIGDNHAGATDTSSVQGNRVEGARSGMELLITIIGLESHRHAFVASPSLCLQQVRTLPHCG